MSKVPNSWRRLGDKLRCWEKKDHIVMTTEMFSPLILMDFSMTHSHMTNRRSSISSNSGTWLNTFVNLFPLITYHSHDESQVLSYCHPFYSYDSFSCVASSFLHGCAIVLTEAARHDSFLTYFWLALFSMLVEYSSNDVVIASSA